MLFYLCSLLQLVLLLLLVTIKILQGQTLFKVKNDPSCSTKMSSRERVHSLLIASKMTEVLNNVSDMLDCQRRCNEDSVCQYAAHKAQENTCAFFKEHLAHETISRLMFQGWIYGRVVTSTGIVSLYFLR